MDFKAQVSFLLTLAFLASFTSCTGTVSSKGDPDSEKIIGTPVTALAESIKSDGHDKNILAIFDSTVRKIHIFNLIDFVYMNSYQVNKPEVEHYVVTQDLGNYIIDLFERKVQIHSRLSQGLDSNMRFVGKPISSSFQSDLNLFVTYDDLANVGMAQLDENGTILKSHTFGPIISDDVVINAGELLANGKLILSLNNNEIAIVDPIECLKNRSWTFTKFHTSLTNIVWVAPVLQNPNAIFVKSEGKLAIIDLVSKSVIDEKNISTEFIEKYSKLYDPHLLTRASADGELKAYFVKDGTIRSRVLMKQSNYILTSHLNLNEDVWSFVDVARKVTNRDAFNNIDAIKTTRELKRFRVSDLAALSKFELKNDAQVRLTQQFVVNLMPSELGYAIRTDIETEDSKVLKMFNMRHIGK